MSAEAARLGKTREEALRAYWTPQRMKAAKPADVLTVDAGVRSSPVPTGSPVSIPPASPKSALGGSPVAGRQLSTADVSQAQPWSRRGDALAVTTGKVFSTRARDKQDRVCSGAIVNSEGKSLVWTAGHCVHSGIGGTWNLNWVFVPDYHYDERPYGTWHAINLASSAGWVDDGDKRYDVGAAIVGSNAGRRIADYLGGQGIQWDRPRGQYVHAFGYPHNAPYNGEALHYCSGGTFDDNPDIGGVGMACNMRGGSSGGPWLVAFDGQTGYVNGNTSYVLQGDSSRLYSPYYGEQAANLYNTMRHKSG